MISVAVTADLRIITKDGDYIMRMKVRNFLGIALIAVVGLLAGQASRASVLYPQLDIVTQGADAGVVRSGDHLSIDATAIAIILSNTVGDILDIPDTDFTLNTAVSTGDGLLTVGSLLTATFANFAFTDLGSGNAAFAADLSYTGGSLAGSLTVGRLEGAFLADTTDLTGDFNASIVQAKLGAVVPVPAAVWLFGSGLLGLVGIARRKTVS